MTVASQKAAPLTTYEGLKTSCRRGHRDKTDITEQR